MSQPGASIAEIQAAILSLVRSQTGINYKDPTLMAARSIVSASLHMYTAANADATCATTTAFTGFASFGLQDNTDWVAATYKTIYSHTGGGVIYGLIGPTAGGAETTTFEITIDGVLKTITITNANTERAVLLAGDVSFNIGNFTQAGGDQNTGALDAATLSTFQTAASSYIPSMTNFFYRSMAALQYDTSCLIRMKHSAIITNSTATAYSAVIVRKRIAS